MAEGLRNAATAALLTAPPAEKVAAARALWNRFQAGEIDIVADGPALPDRPARPARPEWLPPSHMPRRGKAGSPRARFALLHALAHIELNAIDLALDIIGRFQNDPALAGREAAFADEWLAVAADEAKHFLMLADRLEALGSFYGALPAHDGLWAAAMRTKSSLLDRLAIAPLTHEARGLDVTPGMIVKLNEFRDPESAPLLEVIYRDEIGHVATGHRWFAHVCDVLGRDPSAEYSPALDRVGLARPHPPFNEAARREAGLSEAFDVNFGC